MQLKVIKNTPAEVNFNYEEISAHLDEVLQKYNGLVLTDDTVSDGKKVIADLRKGQKSLDEFRKNTKKELTAPVTDFENQCKELSKKFDEVINPITEQAEQFEIKRKHEKKIEVEKVIDEVRNLKGVEYLPLDEKYLNKSTSLKSIKTDLIKVADNILLEQTNHKKNVALIEGKIDLANAKHNLNMLVKPYISMLDYTDIDNILKLIEKDTLELVNKPKGELFPPFNIKSVEKPTVMPSLLDELYVETYEVEGTEDQLDALEAFMGLHNMKWTNK